MDALSKNRAPGSLSVTIHAVRGEHLFADRIEIYAAKERDRFIRACAGALEVEEEIIRSDLRRMHVRLRE